MKRIKAMCKIISQNKMAICQLILLCFIAYRVDQIHDQLDLFTDTMYRIGLQLSEALHGMQEQFVIAINHILDLFHGEPL